MKKKVIKHTFCKRESCNLIGKEVEIEEVSDTKPKVYLGRVDGRLHRFQEGDLE